jgi:hypothetical protein
VHRARRVEEDRARDAAVPPLVLVLDVARVGPLDHDEPDDVALAGADVSGDVELAGEVGVLADADVDPVDGGEEHALRGADVEDDAASRPAGWDLHVPLVDAGRVAVGRREGRPAGERHLDVRVVREVPDAVDVVELLEGPAPRHGQGGSEGRARRDGRERSLWGREELEPPRAVELEALHAVVALPVEEGVHGQPSPGRDLGSRPGAQRRRHAPCLSPPLPITSPADRPRRPAPPTGPVRAVRCCSDGATTWPAGDTHPKGS